MHKAFKNGLLKLHTYLTNLIVFTDWQILCNYLILSKSSVMQLCLFRKKLELLLTINQPLIIDRAVNHRLLPIGVRIFLLLPMMISRKK